jgi:hypothetical protein
MFNFKDFRKVIDHSKEIIHIKLECKRLSKELELDPTNFMLYKNHFLLYNVILANEFCKGLNFTTENCSITWEYEGKINKFTSTCSTDPRVTLINAVLTSVKHLPETVSDMIIFDVRNNKINWEKSSGFFS